MSYHLRFVVFPIACEKDSAMVDASGRQLCFACVNHLSIWLVNCLQMLTFSPKKNPDHLLEKESHLTEERFDGQLDK